MEQNPISETDKYASYCLEMREFLLQRVTLHLRYLTAMYLLILPVLAVLLFVVYQDKQISTEEATVVGILVANLYLLVHFHRKRYYASVAERKKWHRYYESVLRLKMLSELQHNASQVSDLLLAESAKGLFPDFNEATLGAVNQPPGASGDSMKEKIQEGLKKLTS